MTKQILKNKEELDVVQTTKKRLKRRINSYLFKKEILVTQNTVLSYFLKEKIKQNKYLTDSLKDLTKEFIKLNGIKLESINKHHKKSNNYYFNSVLYELKENMNLNYYLIDNLEKILLEQSLILDSEKIESSKKNVKKSLLKIDELTKKTRNNFILKEMPSTNKIKHDDKIISDLISKNYFAKEKIKKQNKIKYSLRQFFRILFVIFHKFYDFPTHIFLMRKIKTNNYCKYVLPKKETITTLKNKFKNTKRFKSFINSELNCESNQFVLVIEKKDNSKFSAQEMRLLFSKNGYNTTMMMEDHRGEQMSGATNINGYIFNDWEKNINNIFRKSFFGKIISKLSTLIFGEKNFIIDYHLKRMAPGEDRRHIKFWNFENTWYGTVHEDLGWFPVSHKLRQKFQNMFTLAPKEKTVNKILEQHLPFMDSTKDYIGCDSYRSGLYKFYNQELSDIDIKEKELWRDTIYINIYKKYFNKYYDFYD